MDKSIKLLELCKIYPQCHFENRIPFDLLESSARRVFLHKYRNGKVYPSDYELLNYITSLQTFEEWTLENDDDDSREADRRIHIGYAMLDFKYLIKELKDEQNERH